MSCISGFFFFNQKTAYGMRISDWSSDVCSSDLIGARDALAKRDRADMPLPHRAHRHDEAQLVAVEPALVGMQDDAVVHQRRGGIAIFVAEIGAGQPELDR